MNEACSMTESAHRSEFEFAFDSMAALRSTALTPTLSRVAGEGEKPCPLSRKRERVGVRVSLIGASLRKSCVIHHTLTRPAGHPLPLAGEGNIWRELL